ncbi:MAG: VOC family protein [Chloroflexi bacterium]|nr:VOC family protein [Chloroflexota bacterium]
MPNPVVHFEINGKDGKKLQEFYAGIFDWHVDANNPMSYGMVDTHAGGINGGVTQAEAAGVTFYIEVDDLQAYLNKVERLGGKTVVPVTVIPNMVTFAQFADPEGNVIGLVKSEDHSA